MIYFNKDDTEFLGAEIKTIAKDIDMIELKNILNTLIDFSIAELQFDNDIESFMSNKIKGKQFTLKECVLKEGRYAIYNEYSDIYLIDNEEVLPSEKIRRKYDFKM